MNYPIRTATTFLGDTMFTSSKLLVIAVVMGAVAVSACRREIPQPMGLGASEMPITKDVTAR